MALLDYFFTSDSLALPARRRQPDLVQSEVDRLNAAGGQHVRNQHVVSRVLLKQFSVATGQGVRVISYRLKFGRSKRTGLDTAGVKENLLRVATESAELCWKAIEDELDPALIALDDTREPVSADHAAVIKDAMALHYTRSVAVVHMSQQIFSQVRTSLRTHLLSADVRDQARWFYDMSGLHSTGPEAREAAIDRAIDGSAAHQLVTSGGWSRVRMEQLFNDVRQAFIPLSLMVLFPNDGEFLIGDVPVITKRRSRSELGIRDGVPIGAADQIFFPLGPKRVACLVDSPGAPQELVRADVDELNEYQIRLAHERVFYRPGADFGHVIRTARPPG